ncbi:PQQ-dependent sugar dehydrogenase [Planctomycetaceae bacterium SH139]
MLLLVFLLSVCSLPAVADDAEQLQRPAWTTSRVVGSPEPPLPFVLERVYSQLEFDKPVTIKTLPVAQPDSDPRLLLVGEQGGKIFSFAADSDPRAAHLVADLTATPPPHCELRPEDSQQIQIYDLAFHPDFLTNRTVVICYVVTAPGKRRSDGTHIASFQLNKRGGSDDPAALTLDVASERPIFGFDSGGHNGCTVAFDREGFLYISTGDVAAPSPPDEYNHGQNVGDVYAAILRIDIDQVPDGQTYGIPADNPFVDHPTARPEIYAYGFRNPWRMSFDDKTGDLWVGDVGWEAWEMVYRVRPGGNYGWPIKEGPGDVRPDASPGPTPILSAEVALPHAEAASITGGVVYHGQALPSLRGKYVYGDWVTRKFWAAAFDKVGVYENLEIAVGPVKPISFTMDHDGELLILDYNSAGKSGIYRLAPNPTEWSDRDFPQQLSETGLFASTQPLRPAAGVVEYSIQAPMYRDGAVARFWLAIPGTAAATFYSTPQTTFDWFRTEVVLPAGTVLVKTYFLETVVGEVASRRPVETQLAHAVSLGEWNHYTYRWDEAGRDASLVPAGGAVSKLQIEDSAAPAGQSELDWIFAARGQCRTCHTPWRGETLGFIEPQLRTLTGYHPDGQPDAWSTMLSRAWIATDPPRPEREGEPTGQQRGPTLVDPYDESKPLAIRARSYLHANCGHCHLNGGNASVAFDVSFTKPLADTGLVEAAAMRGNYRLPAAKLIEPGVPHRSVLLYRTAKLGSGRMPPLGSAKVDQRGVDLLSRWIAEMPRENTAAAIDGVITDGSAEQHIEHWLARLCVSPNKLPESTEGTNDVPAEDLTAINQLLAEPSGALALSLAWNQGRIRAVYKSNIIKQALTAPPEIAELFEAWFAEEARVKRLGLQFDPREVLQLVGDAARGRDSFVAGRGQCAQCHQIHGQGLAVGPELSKIAAKYQRPAELLHHIVQPAAEIAEPYRAVRLLTTDGQVLIGRILSRTPTAIVLQDAAGRRYEINVEAVEEEFAATDSLMPEQLLAALTAQEAADLLAYLSQLK